MEVSPSVFYRDELGRFAERVEDGIDDALQEIGQGGQKRAASEAPQIADTIFYEAEGTTVYWYSTHQWAMAFESGIPAHVIAPTRDHGKLASKPRSFGPVSGPVMHPGMQATHFLTDSYRAMAAQALQIFAKHIPG